MGLQWKVSWLLLHFLWAVVFVCQMRCQTQWKVANKDGCFITLVMKAFWSQQGSKNTFFKLPDANWALGTHLSHSEVFLYFWFHLDDYVAFHINRTFDVEWSSLLRRCPCKVLVLHKQKSDYILKTQSMITNVWTCWSSLRTGLCGS